MAVKMFTVLNQDGKMLMGHLADVLCGHSVGLKYSGHCPYENFTGKNQPR